MATKKSSGNANQESTDKQNYSGDPSQLIEQIAIEGTPFTAIKAEDRWFLALGKYRLTENLYTLKKCKERANKIGWFEIMGVIQIMIEEHEKLRQLQTPK